VAFGDLNADGKDDLYLFNGSDWAERYLGMFRSMGSDFTPVNFYVNDVPGWGGLAEHDQFLPADLKGNGRVGLFAWNIADWGSNYAGRMVSTGKALVADWRQDWIGEWHLGAVDVFTATKPSARRIIVDQDLQLSALSRGLRERFDDLSVVGIDISPTSLDHTEALKQKYELTNLETRQLPIENAADLDHQFDFVISTGVLHHLVDPDAGTRALRSVLSEEGVMYLMLYAPYGRTGVSMIQDYCRRLGVGATPEEIKDLSLVLRMLPQHHPLLLMLRGSRESLDANAMVDAVLNPRDRTYSVPEVFEFIERNDLKFSRWYFQAPISLTRRRGHSLRLPPLVLSTRGLTSLRWRSRSSPVGTLSLSRN
jgi:SAM-dependent methyltransferase